MCVAGHLDTVDPAGGVHQLMAVIDIVVDAALGGHVGEDDVADRTTVDLPSIAGVIPVKLVGVAFDSPARIR